jgi:hypothetical protein
MGCWRVDAEKKNVGPHSRIRVNADVAATVSVCVGGITRWQDALIVSQQRHGSMTIEQQISSVGELRLVGQSAEAEVSSAWTAGC